MANLIFDKDPASWKELETLVHLAFCEMGYEADLQKKIPKVRGDAVVDVYAVKTSQSIPTCILCECKHWDKAVDQNVVFAFRSVCGDSGAHYGLIISKKGFQSGAIEACKFTNVHLLDFNGFQETFFNEWIRSITNTMAVHADYLNFLHPEYERHCELDMAISCKIEEKLKNVDVMAKYDMYIGRDFVRFFSWNEQFPAEVIDPRGDPYVIRNVTVKSHREYYEIFKSGVSDVFRHLALNKKTAFSNAAPIARKSS